MQNVLLITSTRIGDAIINSGVLRYLVETRPEARFTIACGPLAAPLFAAVPRLDRVIVMAKKKAGAHWFDLWRATIGQQWDLVVDLRCSATAWALRAKERRILRQTSAPIHKVAEAATALGIDTVPDPKIYLSDAARAKAAELLPDGTPVLAICPSASMPYKVWPGERFGELVKRLTAPDGAMAGARVAIFGGPGDEAAAAPIHAALPDASPLDAGLLDFTGQLGLMDVAACLQRARLFIGNDSGLMHMAAAMQTPTLGLFGPSDERRYGPYGAHCAIVRGAAGFAEIDAAFADRRLHPESLLLDLDVDAALDAAAALLQRS
ncbi:glycosyltransferase family 9 protein [Maricaulis salignorans]|uniref:ADP-heptose:LPS heptosyltransferase n=1 Tax=Maricaulis salignorans TaxID=144026 RepID=A0A1G9MM31_9PROT|nr:glycosyltransferase family 9 protein [Maricaulis salignorans]SDL75346.1 ADP-heptose:LPS heptosyltransferase [Maricaulis salignorans]